jgi:hypothetical protein
MSRIRPPFPLVAGERTRSSAFLAAALALAVLAGFPAEPAGAAGEPAPPVPDLGPYIVIGWNDLGMHCANRHFADLCVLPPFNNMWSVVIRRGNETTPPAIVGPGFSVEYSIQDNTYSVGKTDFWSWEDRLFGVQLPDNIGLTGHGLTGAMDPATDHFRVDGVPLTPYTDLDLVHEQPFQLANLRAYDSQHTLIATSQIVAPISGEMTCNACHHPLQGETVEHAILRRHDAEEGTNLVSQRPVLCANCHGSNALGMPGNPNLPSLSLAMHGQHAEETNDCYMCHPGPVTQCLRDVMSQQFGLTCQSCHGSVYNVARTIELGREPWLQEPRCGTCHGPAFAEMPNTLYRNSNNGHGGLYCEACHNSPHAIVPSREERDNRQFTALQGHAGTLTDCTVCHGSMPTSPGPHGFYPSGLRDRTPLSLAEARVSVWPNPIRESAEIHYRVVDNAPVSLAIHDAAGREVRVLTRNVQTPGDHTLVWDGADQGSRAVPAGVYFVRLQTGGKSATARMIKIGG